MTNARPRRLGTPSRGLLPTRLLGVGARSAERLASVTGANRALEDAMEEAIVRALRSPGSSGRSSACSAQRRTNGASTGDRERRVRRRPGACTRGRNGGPSMAGDPRQQGHLRVDPTGGDCVRKRCDWELGRAGAWAIRGSLRRSRAGWLPRTRQERTVTTVRSSTRAIVCDRQESPHRAFLTVRRSGQSNGCYGCPRRNRPLRRRFSPRSGDGIEPSKRRAAPPCRF
jgi:hypothetical protein